MTDHSEDLILESSGAMPGDIAGIKGKLDALFMRIGSVEGHLARIETHLDQVGGDVLHPNARCDSLAGRIDRIQRGSNSTLIRTSTPVPRSS